MERLNLSMRARGAALAVALLLSAVGSGATVKPEAARFYEDALVRFDKKDYKGSIIQLKNALQIDKEMLPVHLLMGRALLEDGQPGQAEIALSEAYRLGVNKAELVLDLARSLSDQGKQASLLTDARFVGAGLPPAVHAKLALAKGSAAADIGNLREAYRHLAEARRLAPQSPDSWLAESTLLLREGKFADATAALDKAVALSSESAMSLYQRGQIEHLNGRLAAAAALYGKALRQDPAHLESLLARAGVLIDLGQPQEAAKDVAEARRIEPGDARGPFLSALLAERSGNAETTRRELKTVTALVDPVPLDYIKYKPQILMLNGLAHYGLGEREAALPYLEAYHRLDPAGGVAKLLARIQLSNNKPAAAIATLDQYVRARPRDPQAQTLLASAHMAQGNPGRAVSIAREALKTADTAELRNVLGMGMLRSGQVRNAQADLEAYHRKNPKEVGTATLLANIYIRQGQGAKAVALIEPLRKLAPKDVGLTVLLGQARLAAKDAAGARKVFEEALALAPNSKQATMPLVRLDMLERKPDAAAARLARLLQANDKDPELLFTLASVEEQRGKLVDAQRTLERANELSGPRDARAGLALVDLHMRYKRPAEAAAVAKSLTARMPEEVKPQLALTRVLLAQSDRDGAKAALTQAARVAPLEAEVQVEIGLLQMMAGNLPASAYSLEKALQAEPGFLPALAALTEVDLKRGDVEVARNRATEIVRQHPKQAIGHSLLGDIAWARGDVKAATTAYQQAHQVQPSTDTMVNLHRALRWRDGPAAALAFGDQWLKTRPQDDRARVVQASLLASSGQPAIARQQYEAVLKRRPNDPQVLNNLANVLLTLDKAAALTVAERALAAAPADPGVIDTAGWVLLQNGQTERALQLLRDARLRRPADPTIRYHLAEALVQVGRKAEAKAELDVALAAAPRFEGSEQARTLLQSLQR